MTKKKVTGVKGLTILKMKTFMSTNGLLPYLPDPDMCMAYDFTYMINVSKLFHIDFTAFSHILQVSRTLKRKEFDRMLNELKETQTQRRLAN